MKLAVIMDSYESLDACINYAEEVACRMENSVDVMNEQRKVVAFVYYSSDGSVDVERLED